nr:MAG TPA: coiled-coil domain-containing protein [Caudoviricetes sp.]
MCINRLVVVSLVFIWFLLYGYYYMRSRTPTTITRVI